VLARAAGFVDHVEVPISHMASTVPDDRRLQILLFSDK
jgi:hypothetical protein